MPTAKVGDLDIAWEEFGTGDPVIMINGIGADRTAWHLQTPAISREFRAITFDNRDVGETGPGREPRTYGIRRFADDTAGLMDVLGIERAHIVGASMGGAIAQEFALAHPARTRSATIICSWPQTDPWLAELWERWEHVFEALGPVEWARASWLMVFTHRYYNDPDNLKNLIEVARTNPNPQTFDMYRRQSRAAAAHDTLGRLPKITASTHVICGAEDIFTPLRYAQAIAGAIPDARLSVMPAVGHGMFWEATDAFNELVLEFLRGAGNEERGAR